jgi:hypothetical protein
MIQCRFWHFCTYASKYTKHEQKPADGYLITIIKPLNLEIMDKEKLSIEEEAVKAYEKYCDENGYEPFNVNPKIEPGIGITLISLFNEEHKVVATYNADEQFVDVIIE